MADGPLHPGSWQPPARLLQSEWELAGPRGPARVPHPPMPLLRPDGSSSCCLSRCPSLFLPPTRTTIDLPVGDTGFSSRPVQASPHQSGFFLLAWRSPLGPCVVPSLATLSLCQSCPERLHWCHGTELAQGSPRLGLVCQSREAAWLSGEGWGAEGKWVRVWLEFRCGIQGQFPGEMTQEFCVT